MNENADQPSEPTPDIDVSADSAGDTQAPARRHSNRWLATRVGAAALLVGAGVIGIQQLTTPGLAGDPIDTPNNVAAPSTTLSTGQATTEATVAAVPTGTENYPTDEPWLAGTPQHRSAEYTDLGLNWTAYGADSPEALALRFNPDDRYAIGTTEGSDGYFTDAIFAQTDNGWEEIEPLPNSYQHAVIGDTVYAVFWEEGPNPYSPGTETFRAFDIPTRTWRDVALPEGAVPTVPADSDSLMAPYYTALATRGDQLVVSVSGAFEFDPSTFDGGSGEDVWVDMAADGTIEVVMTDQECVDRVMERSGIATSVPYAEPTKSGTAPATPAEPANTAAATTDIDGTAVAESVPATTAAPDPVATTSGPGIDTLPPVETLPDGPDPFAECERRVDPSEVGLSDTEIALIGTPVNTLWTMTGESWQQVELPNEDHMYTWLSSGGVVSVNLPSKTDDGWETTNFYVVADDNTLQPLFDGHTFNAAGYMGWDRGNRDPQSAIVATGSYILSQDLTTGTWSATDLSTLGEGTGWGAYSATPLDGYDTPNGGVIASGYITTGLPAEPTELTSGDYTIRWPARLDGAVTVTNNATGEVVEDFYVSTDSGQVKVMRYSTTDDYADAGPGTTVLLEPIEETLATFDTDWRDVPALAARSTGAVFVSPDGARFDAVDADTLKALVEDEPSKELMIDTVDYSGDQIIVSATLLTDSDWGGDSYVFVGTPS